MTDTADVKGRSREVILCEVEEPGDFEWVEHQFFEASPGPFQLPSSSPAHPLPLQHNPVLRPSPPST